MTATDEQPPPPAGQRYIDYLPLDDIAPAKRNAKKHNRPGIVGSITEFNFADPCLLDERTTRLIAGHGRLEALMWMRDANYSPPDGITSEGADWLVPVVRGWSSRDDAQAHAAGIAINRHTELGGWDDGVLLSMMDEIRESDAGLLEHVGFTRDDLDAMLDGINNPDGDGGDEDGESGDDTGPDMLRSDGPSLADRFLIPPFDVLDARQGWWRDRKRSWINVGIASYKGRSAFTYDDDGNLLDTSTGLLFSSASGSDPAFYNKKRAAEQRLGVTMTAAEFTASGHYEPPDEGTVCSSGTSVFDPVLCELTYRWFSPPDGTVLDPFAGGSVRGLVAALLGRRYIGNDLDAEQIAANREQADTLTTAGLIDRDQVSWTYGDSATWVPTLDPESADLLFSCPPYLWLEQYDPDDPSDLSNLDAAGFETAFTEILTGAVAALRNNRYAVLVVGDVRDNKGRLHDLRGMTIRAAETAGLTFQSGGVLVTPVGSVAARGGRAFDSTRVLGRVHQDVLVFYKGNASRAAQACGDVTLDMPEHEHITTAFDGTGPAEPGGDYTPEYTPIEQHAGIWVKRDDAWTWRGASGAKARAMIHAAEETGAAGILSAGARQSPQLERAALAAAALGIPARLHTGAGKDTDETRTAEHAGADLQRHKPARLTVIKARFETDRADPGYADWLHVPFGMDHPAYLEEVATQAEALPVGAYGRIVVPTGSGMTLAGILTGLDRASNLTPVLAVQVVADPTERLDRSYPAWRERATLVQSDLDYDTRAANTLGDLRLDPIYEAKTLPHLQENDLLWCVGARASISNPQPVGEE